ncbi:hypothetical protein ACN47E_009295 [Coniothyrium glycines]
MGLQNLSPELLLCVASFLRQVDLLNISLTCKYLQSATEPELFREYKNTRIFGRSFYPFIDKLIERPEICKYFQKLQFKQWETLDSLNPRFHKSSSRQRRTSDEQELASRIASFENECRKQPQPTEAQYVAFTRAARKVGVITEIFPFEPTSHVLDSAREMLAQDVDPSRFWYTHAFDKSVSCRDIGYDRKFCQLLRAGVEDAQIVLLVALLPNVREILFHGVPGEVESLEWRAGHEFSCLRRLTASVHDSDIIWPIAWIRPLLKSARLEVFEASGASSWYQHFDDTRPEVDLVQPLHLKPNISDLRYLDLQDCCLKVADLGALLQACRGLTTFMYSGKIHDSEWSSPSPAKMVELLHPFRNTLEVLSLEIDIDTYEGWDLFQPELIDSLAHMTALKILDTTPEMWDAVETNDFELTTENEDDADVQQRRLCYRLPPNVHTIMFHMSDVQEMMSLTQLSDLIRMRAELLPDLQFLYIGTPDEEYTEEIEELLRIMDDVRIEGKQALNVSTGHGTISSVFHKLHRPHDVPETKWCGDKYAVRRRKPGIVQRTMADIARKYSAIEDEADAVYAMRHDPEFANLMPYLVDKFLETVEYDSSDAEELDF